MFKLITLYSSLYFPAEEGRRKQVSMESVSLIISDMPYPGSFNKDEFLKIALLWGKYDDSENETARIDKVRWQFIKFYGLQKTPRLSPPRHIQPAAAEHRSELLRGLVGGWREVRHHSQPPQGPGLRGKWWLALWAPAQK